MTPSSRQFALATFVLGCCLYLTGVCQSIALPMAAKLLLPRLGGAPWHWTIFQAMFGGAAGLACVLVFVLRRWIAWRPIALAGLGWGIAVIVLLAFDPTAPQRRGIENESLFVLRALAPFGAAIFAMNFTSLAMLGWLCEHDSQSKRRPYLLYGLCLLGMSHGLLAYPVVVEPLVSLEEQWTIFRGAAVAIGLSFAAVAVLIATGDHEPDLDPAKLPTPTWSQRLFWMLLAGIPSAADLVTTAHFATDLSPIPLVWLVPLYLLGLGWVSALTDPSAQEDSRTLPVTMRVLALLPVVVFVSIYLLNEPRPSLPGIGIVAVLMLPFVTPLRWNFAMMLLVVPLQIGAIYEAEAFGVPFDGRIALCFLAMALVSRVCLGQLVRIAPGPGRFVQWLLLASLGAGVCRVLVQDLSPLIFTTLLEYPITLGLAWVVCIVVRVMRDRLEPDHPPDA